MDGGKRNQLSIRCLLSKEVSRKFLTDQGILPR